MEAPTVAGSVTAGITIGSLSFNSISLIFLIYWTLGDDTADEIDIELIGGDSNHWQTNVYSPSPKDKQPLWGVFGEKHSVGSSSVAQLHNYTIDWNMDRIIWSVDGRSVRTLKPGELPANWNSSCQCWNRSRKHPHQWDITLSNSRVTDPIRNLGCFKSRRHESVGEGADQLGQSTWPYHSNGSPNFCRVQLDLYFLILCSLKLSWKCHDYQRRLHLKMQIQNNL